MLSVCEASKRKFPSVLYQLKTNSKTFKQLLESCSEQPQSSPGPVEIPLDDSEEDVDLLWGLFHGRRQVNKELSNVRVPELLQQTLDRISSIARMADKYASEGECKQALHHM